MTRMDRFRLLLARWVFSPLQGVTFGGWMRVLADNRLRVHPAFWPRAALTTASALVTSVQARREERLYGAAVDATTVQPPLFVLGHYRNGTTHLHNLLATDPRFAYLNNFQANQPRTFLTTEAVGARLGAFFTMRKRPHDDVRLDLRVPTEDELALCADTFLSPHMAWHFPARAEHYNRRYLTFEQASEQERRRWLASLARLARKLTFKYDRPLVFKSPLHTARIPLLLAAFPDARFVHLHRDPFRVFLSTRNMERKVEPLFRYQKSRWQNLDERILWRYRTLYAAFFRHVGSIPAGRFVEVSYEQLERDPLGTLAQIYEALQLPPFAEARPHVQAYLASLRGYRKNVYPEIEAALRRRIVQAWGFCFDAWGYPTRSRSPA